MDRIRTLKVVSILMIFILGVVIGMFINLGREGLRISGNVVLAPSDVIGEREIITYPDKIVIQVDNATVTNYEDSGSMAPTLGQGMNGIRVVPKSVEEVNLGDVISFIDGNKLVVHRVIEKGSDENGIYFITMGDNSQFADGKIRFEDIKYLTIGVIY